jgi:hypothetical protein
VFTVHKIVSGKRFVPLEKNRDYKNKLEKIVIPPEHFSNIRKDLHIHNINAVSLFPDIDGLCKHLEWRYSKYKDET